MAILQQTVNDNYNRWFVKYCVKKINEKETGNGQNSVKSEGAGQLEEA